MKRCMKDGRRKNRQIDKEGWTWTREWVIDKVEKFGSAVKFVTSYALGLEKETEERSTIRLLGEVSSSGLSLDPLIR